MEIQEALTYDISWVAESVKRYTGFDGNKLAGVWNAMQGYIKHIMEESKTEIPEVQTRRLYNSNNPDGYMESDKDFVENNFEACVWFLENHKRLLVTRTANNRLESTPKNGV